MNRLKNYIANIPVVSFFVLGGCFIGMMVCVFVLALAIHGGKLKEGRERALVVSQCVEKTPNDVRMVEHCMLKYNFIIGK